MKLIIEHMLTGPLSNPRVRSALKEAAADAKTFEEAAHAVDGISGLATYRGGCHVAVHPVYKGRFAHGSQRLALIIQSKAVVS